MAGSEDDYVIRVLNSPLEVSAEQWNALLALQPDANPFMRHEYLAAMHESGSATPKTGWTPRFVTLWKKGPADLELVAACALYLKDHSYGEYVFDHAWANAYHQHGLAYYPKALIAPPFTPVPGARLLAIDAATRLALVKALVHWCAEEDLSSLHLLFASDVDVEACQSAGLMLRHNVQFHWKNIAPAIVASLTALPPEGAGLAWGGPALRSAPTLGAAPDLERPFSSFEGFLMSLSQDKRKKIRQERRKVADAGVTFRWSLGKNITSKDWEFFYSCYERTYYEHGNAPYLSRDFFHRMAAIMPENWLLFVGERGGQPIATSLIAIHAYPTRSESTFGIQKHRKPRWIKPMITSPMVVTGVPPSAWIVCTLRLATTSRCNGASSTASSALRAVLRANTKWPAPCCPCGPPAPTGWPIRASPMPWSVFWSARGRVSTTTWTIWRNAIRSRKTRPELAIREIFFSSQATSVKRFTAGFATKSWFLILVCWLVLAGHPTSPTVCALTHPAP